MSRLLAGFDLSASFSVYVCLQQGDRWPMDTGIVWLSELEVFHCVCQVENIHTVTCNILRSGVP